MPKFTVKCSEIVYFDVEVEADTEEEVMDKVWEKCNPYDLPKWCTDATDFEAYNIVKK